MPDSPLRSDLLDPYDGHRPEDLPLVQAYLIAVLVTRLALNDADESARASLQLLERLRPRPHAQDGR